MYTVTFIIHDKDSNSFILREQVPSDNYIDREIRKYSREQNLSYFLAFKKIVRDYIDQEIITKCIVLVDTGATSIEIDALTIKNWDSFFIYKTYSSDGGSSVNEIPEYIGIIYDDKHIEINAYTGEIVKLDGFTQE